MATIAYILLCHKDPDAIIDQAARLTAVGDYVSIHFDGNAPKDAYDQIRAAFADNDRVTFAAKRIKCGWGEWSLVDATLQAVDAALNAFPRATHFYMLSGDCIPIKSAEYAHRFLDENDADFIESFDFFNSNWIKTGIKEERLIYRHYLNERKHKWLFYQMLNLQRRLGLTRQIPKDLQVQIGSQWWCLRRQTVEAVMDFVRARRDVMRFFSTTWIPDETFFQTIVRHLVPSDEIRSRTLTFLMFTDYGMPATFYNDHYDMLLAQDFLFARKVSAEATELKRRTGDLYAATGVEFSISNEGRALFAFLRNRGRIGHRYAPRFWENEATLGRDRELLIIFCKKWHVAKRLAARIRDVTDIPVIEYLFHEESTPLPDLGGIQASLYKRSRHRRSLMRMLFDYFKTSRMVICLDPSSPELIKDFTSDRAVTSILEIDCTFDDAYVAGHAKRTGLAPEDAPDEALERLIPTVRDALQMEADVIRDAGYENYSRIRQSATTAQNAEEIARFLAVPDHVAQDLAQTRHLFDD
ncbi:DUF5928 domain-containing protein [Pseudooceanicola sp. MF1-13]|uniref:DUF5928 domain-containing protein n=1 Tax=Pseudooceanicola sp. MF1-13 TaxID=3379095 RepID=UPI003891CC13